MTGLEMMELAKAKRAAKGLKLQWFIPSENRVFTAFAKDEAQKQEWLSNGEAKGWVLQ
jgi:hypothetical protein